MKGCRDKASSSFLPDFVFPDSLEGGVAVRVSTRNGFVVATSVRFQRAGEGGRRSIIFLNQ